MRKKQRYQTGNNGKKKKLFDVRTKLSYNKIFSENSLAIEIKKTHILMNKPVCLGLSILVLSTIVMYKFWYTYVKLKYGKKAKLCYMDADTFTVHIKQMTFIRTLQKMLKRVFTI